MFISYDHCLSGSGLGQWVEYYCIILKAFCCALCQKQFINNLMLKWIKLYFFFLRTPPTPHKIKAKSDVMLGQSLYLTIWLNISIIQQHPTVFANISWETANRNPTDSLSTTASYQRKASPSPTASGTTWPVKTNDWPCIKILYLLKSLHLTLHS